MSTTISSSARACFPPVLFCSEWLMGFDGRRYHISTPASQPIAVIDTAEPIDGRTAVDRDQLDAVADIVRAVPALVYALDRISRCSADPTAREVAAFALQKARLL
jgi:hypothetical protein